MLGVPLYGDTDSVYCLLPKPDEKIEDLAFGSTFGIKNECHLDDANEYVCVAPKCYSYTN